MKRLLLLAALAAACQKTLPAKDYSKLVSSNPRAILVVPVVNKSVDVDAANYFLSTLSVPLAERGYYVFPVNLVKRMLEDDGLSDAALVHGANPVRLCTLFGADAVLYVTIQQWTARYIVLSTQVTVEFDYLLKDGRTGEELWKEHQIRVFDSSSANSGGSGGLLGSLIGSLAAAVATKAAPNYMPLARDANTAALAFPGPGIPAGPYRREYRKDLPPSAPAPAASPPAKPAVQQTPSAAADPPDVVQ